MPIIDALMRELNYTGFMPNRGRMVVACYLTMDIRQDWRYGASYFEQMLLDHDCSSNYGGWAGSSGIGAGRVLVFNSLTQSQKFDPKGDYIRRWVPELEDVPDDYIHDPWNMPAILQKNSGVQIGGDKPKEGSEVKYYPAPIKCDKYTTLEAAKKIKRSSGTKAAPVAKKGPTQKTLLDKLVATKI